MSLVGDLDVGFCKEGKNYPCLLSIYLCRLFISVAMDLCSYLSRNGGCMGM